LKNALVRINAPFAAVGKALSKSFQRALQFASNKGSTRTVIETPAKGVKQPSLGRSISTPNDFCVIIALQQFEFMVMKRS
jgi:hypothetical protein